MAVGSFLSHFYVKDVSEDEKIKKWLKRVCVNYYNPNSFLLFLIN